MKKLFINSTLLFAAMVFGCVSVYAQESPKIFGKTVTKNPENGLIRCASSEYEDYLRTKFGMESREEFEAWLAPKIAKQKAMRSANSTNEIITIPVVVHVIHNGDAVGSNENIAYEQVLSQITVLNQDYRRMADTPGWNENSVGADTEIQFCLAQRDPDGNATDGVDRVNLGQASWGSSSETTTIQTIDDEVKAVTYWDPTEYMNIWTVNYNSQSTLLGYAQFPNTNSIGGVGVGNGGASTDGVVIGYKYFGSKTLYPSGNYESSNTYVYGRTATHEVGHFLGLLHIWGDNTSCTVNTTDSNKDYCPDTPAANTAHYTCGTFDTCPSSAGNDMDENYMDYTNDACMDTFTQDQAERMQTVMNNATRRKSLLTSPACQAPTGSVEDFRLLNNMYLYPNPSQTVVTIASAENELPDSYTIYNSLGQTITTVVVNGSTDLTVNTSAYANGVYLVKVNKGKESKVLKFVKN
jgi:Pregnancy-associated plasma protein-A/Secretion system C-terminal sorting domain